MPKLEEMSKWNYAKAWKFFTENAFNCCIPETQTYLASTTLCRTQDLRFTPYNERARETILESLQKKTLVLIDGATLNGKSTLSERISSHIKGNIVDIDLICAAWVEEQLSQFVNPVWRMSFIMNINRLTDDYILSNLEKIVQEKSRKGTVILVGSYMEVIYRGIISKTLGKYFDQVVSIYCVAKTFSEVKRMKQKRDREFAISAITDEQVLNQYNYSKRLLKDNGIMLGIGMNHSFITDNSVSDLFL